MFRTLSVPAASCAAALLLTASVCSAQPPQDQPPQPPAQEQPPPPADDRPPQDQDLPPDPDQPQEDEEHPERLRPLETPETLEPMKGEPLPPRASGIGSSERPSTVQRPSTRPYRGLFGGARPRDADDQTLSLTLSAFGGWDEPYDTAVLPELPDERAEAQGQFAGSSGTLYYNRPGERLTLNGYGSGFLGYFPDSEQWYDSTSAGGAASFRFAVGRRTGVRIAQVEHWSTDLALGSLGAGSGLGLGGGVPIPPATGDTAFDFSFRRAPSLTSSSELGVDHRLSNKSSLLGSFHYRNAYFFDEEDGLPTRHDYQGGLTYSRRLTRFMSLRAGYNYRTSRSDLFEGEPRQFHDIDLGVDYARSLPLSRRTLLSFSTGSTITARDSVGEDEEITVLTNTRFFVVGAATLTHEVSRSWMARLSYTRDLRYEDGFGDPFLRDNAVASIGGLVGRRVDLVGYASWTSAAIGLDDRNFSYAMASAQARTAITENLAAYVNYYYYLQNFDADVALPPGVIRDLSRQGVRVGLTTWLPLWSSR